MASKCGQETSKIQFVVAYQSSESSEWVKVPVSSENGIFAHIIWKFSLALIILSSLVNQMHDLNVITFLQIYINCNNA